MSDGYIGDVRAMSFGFAPHGWAKCDGQLMPISRNQALFQLLGTRYGGDGKTTFGLPALPGIPAQDDRTLTYCINIQGSVPMP